MAESKAYRSKMMSKIKGTGGKAETQLAKALWHQGVRYFKNYKKLPGTPDIAITKYNVMVFVDGEFWHGYDWENVKQKKNPHEPFILDTEIRTQYGKRSRSESEIRRNGLYCLTFLGET